MAHLHTVLVISVVVELHSNCVGVDIAGGRFGRLRVHGVDGGAFRYFHWQRGALK